MVFAGLLRLDERSQSVFLGISEDVEGYVGRSSVNTSDTSDQEGQTGNRPDWKVYEITEHDMLHNKRRLSIQTLIFLAYIPDYF